MMVRRLTCKLSIQAGQARSAFYERGRNDISRRQQCAAIEKAPAREAFEISDGENRICWLAHQPLSAYRLLLGNGARLSDQDYKAFTGQLAALIMARTDFPLLDFRLAEKKRQQKRRSFLSALIWASIGTLLIIAAIAFLLIQQPANLSYVSLIGGAVVEGIAGLNFYLYGRASNQLSAFQAPLERIGRLLLANSICENLEGNLKHETRSRLVDTIANMPVYQTTSTSDEKILF